MITFIFESRDCCDLIKKDLNVDLFSVRYFDRKQIKIYIYKKCNSTSLF